MCIRDRAIAEAITEEVGRLDEAGYEVFAGQAFKLREDNAKALLLFVGSSKLVFLTLHPDGMEDIPASLSEMIEDENLIPIDSHNSFSDDVRDLEGDNLRSFLGILLRASTISQSSDDELLAAYSILGLKEYSIEEGIGPLGVSALLIGPRKSISAIISLDGNNAFPEVRDEIVKKLEELGFPSIEVVTTDTHIVNGWKFGGRGYHPLGERIPAKILAEKAFDAASRALTSLKPMEVKRIRLRFEGIRVMSEEFLTEAAEKTYESLKLFIAFASTSPILATLLAALSG